MKIDPHTTREHIISVYGHITGLKKEICTIKNNHLKHMSCAIYKIEKKVDKILWYMITGMGAVIVALITIVLKMK